MLDLVALKRRYKHFKINSKPNNTCTSGFGCFSVVWRGFVMVVSKNCVFVSLDNNGVQRWNLGFVGQQKKYFSPSSAARRSSLRPSFGAERKEQF